MKSNKSKTIKITVSIILAILIIAGVIFGVMSCQNQNHSHSHETEPITTQIPNDSEQTGENSSEESHTHSTDTEPVTDETCVPVETTGADETAGTDETSVDETADVPGTESDTDETTVMDDSAVVGTETDADSETVTDSETVVETGTDTETNHTHKFTTVSSKDPTCEEDGYKTVACECGETSTLTLSRLGHKWSEWKTVKDSSCSSEGVKERICSVCGKKETGTIAKKDHKYTRKLTKDPTCTEKGLYTYTCSVCGKSYTESIPARGHNWDEWVVIKQVSETEDGIQERTCERCGKKETKIIEKKEDLCPRTKDGHHWYELCSVDTIPTETTEGKSTWTCHYCNKTITKTTPPQKKGDIEKFIKEWKDRYEKNPDIDLFEYVDGLHMRGYTFETIWGGAARFCRECGKDGIDLDHSMFSPFKITNGIRKVTKEPTATEKGEAHLICEHCGAIIDTLILPAKNDPMQYGILYHSEPINNYTAIGYSVKIIKLYSEYPDYDLKEMVYFKFYQEHPEMDTHNGTICPSFADVRSNAGTLLDITILSERSIKIEFDNVNGVHRTVTYDTNTLKGHTNPTVELNDWDIVITDWIMH